MVLTVLSVAFGFFTKIQPIKERFTTPHHSINTIPDSSDSRQLTQAGNAQSGLGRNFPEFPLQVAGGQATAARSSMGGWILGLRMVPAHVAAGAVSTAQLSAASQEMQGAAPAALASPVQI